MKIPIMTPRNSPSSHPQETRKTISPDVIRIVQNMYTDHADEVLGRLEEMDTGVRKVVVAAIKGTHAAMGENENALGDVFEA